MSFMKGARITELHRLSYCIAGDAENYALAYESEISLKVAYSYFELCTRRYSFHKFVWPINAQGMRVIEIQEHFQNALARVASLRLMDIVYI